MQIMCTSLECVQEKVFSCDMVPTLTLYQETQGLVNFKNHYSSTRFLEGI